MTDILVYQPDGSTRTTITVDSKTYLQKALMGDDYISCSIITTQKESVLSSIVPGDYITFQSENYYLNRPSQIERLAYKKFKYTFTFEGEIYRLLDKTFRQPVTGNSDFYLVDTAEGILDVLLTNINSEFTGWTKGTVYSTERKLINFDGDSCRNVLNKIANEFEVEFYLIGKQINIVQKHETDTLYSFSVGQGNGLYSLKRLNIDNENTTTRAYLYGGSTNITSDYRNGSKRLVYESATGERYIEDYTHFDRLVEDNVVFEEIYPRYTGLVSTVEAVDGVNKKITCEIDFDINDYLLSGTAAKVVFKTGDLTGREFEIEEATYDSGTGSGSITLIPYTDDGDLEYPNDTLYPRISDEFTLINISMPQAYIDAAEAELLAAGEEWLSIYSQLRVKYELSFDPRYIRDNGIQLNIGDKLNITDTFLGIDQPIRVTSLKINLDDPNNITVEVSNIINTGDDLEGTIQETTDKISSDLSGSFNIELQAIKNWVIRNFASDFTDTSIEVLGVILKDEGYDDIILQNEEGIFTAGGYEVWTAGNDGAGSGLNACLLDNYHASAFPRKTEQASIDAEWTFNEAINLNGFVYFDSAQQFRFQRADQDYVSVMMGGGVTSEDNEFIVRCRSSETEYKDLLWDNKGRLSVGYGWSAPEALSVRGNQNITGYIKGDGTVDKTFAGSNWQLDSDDGDGYSHLFIDNITVRRMAKFYQLEIDETTHIGGAMLLSCAHGKITTISGSNFYIDIDEGNNPVQFKVDDYVWAQAFSGRESGYFLGQVTAVATAIDQSTAYITVSTIDGTPWEGMELIQCGNETNTTRQGLIYMSTVEADSPYMSFLAGVDDGSFDGKQVVQLGDLSLINHDYWGQLSGIGLMCDHGYFDNVHVRGSIEITGDEGNAATKDYADNLIELLNIGGRNLVRNSYEPIPITLNNTLNQTGSLRYVYWDGLQDGDEITISGKLTYTNVVQTGDGTASLYIQGRGNVTGWTSALPSKNILDQLDESGTGELYFSYTATINEGQLSNDYHYYGYRADYLTGSIEFSQLKVEKGNKATAWTPAHEDIEDYADNAVSGLETSLGEMAYYDLVLDALEDETIIVGGYINTSLLDADYIKSDIINATYLSSSAIRAAIITTDYLEGLSLDFTQGSIGSFNISGTQLYTSNFFGDPGQGYSGLGIRGGSTPYITMFNPSGYVEMFINSDTDWGFTGGNWTDGDLLRLGSENFIGPLNIIPEGLHNEEFALISDSNGTNLYFYENTESGGLGSGIRFLLGTYSDHSANSERGHIYGNWNGLDKAFTLEIDSDGDTLTISDGTTTIDHNLVVDGGFSFEGNKLKFGSFVTSDDSTTYTVYVSGLSTLTGVVVSQAGSTILNSGNSFNFNRINEIDGTQTVYYIAWGT